MVLDMVLEMAALRMNWRGLVRLLFWFGMVGWRVWSGWWARLVWHGWSSLAWPDRQGWSEAMLWALRFQARRESCIGHALVRVAPYTYGLLTISTRRATLSSNVLEAGLSGPQVPSMMLRSLAMSGSPASLSC
eukprot:6026738-Pyramimonas_sp.AAC.1